MQRVWAIRSCVQDRLRLENLEASLEHGVQLRGRVGHALTGGALDTFVLRHSNSVAMEYWERLKTILVRVPDPRPQLCPLPIQLPILRVLGLGAEVFRGCHLE